MPDETEAKPKRATRRQPYSATTPADPRSEEAATPPAFEDALTRLDLIVAQLEGGQLPLDQALTLFEEGVRLYQQCERLLETADLRLQRLRARTGETTATAGDLFFVETFEMDER